MPFFEEDLKDPLIEVDTYVYKLPSVFPADSYYIDLIDAKYATINGDELVIDTRGLEFGKHTFQILLVGNNG